VILPPLVFPSAGLGQVPVGVGVDGDGNLSRALEKDVGIALSWNAGSNVIKLFSFVTDSSERIS
jgi:hypothetical protein